jgi:hypothetical protein
MHLHISVNFGSPLANRIIISIVGTVLLMLVTGHLRPRSLSVDVAEGVVGFGRQHGEVERFPLAIIVPLILVGLTWVARSVLAPTRREDDRRCLNMRYGTYSIAGRKSGMKAISIW